VLFLIYDLERGGPELRLLDFARHFPSSIRVHICTTSGKLALLTEFLQTDAKILVIPVKRGYLEFNKGWKIYQYVKMNHISIVNSFGLKELFLANVIKIFSRSKIKTVHHSVEFLHHYGFRQKAFLIILFKLTDAVICNSNMLKKLMTSFLVPEKKTTVIKNGIDTSIFSKTTNEIQTLKYEFGIVRNQIVLGTVANFRKGKNYPFLLNAYRILLKKYPDLKLLCVGGGGLIDSMKDLARSHAIDKLIIFTGYSKDVVKYMKLMDIFCSMLAEGGVPECPSSSHEHESSGDSLKCGGL
jgi:glycosyltransferase involved in cell wall biosynthesis